MGHESTCDICNVTFDDKDRPHVCTADDLKARIEALEEEIARDEEERCAAICPPNLIASGERCTQRRGDDHGGPTDPHFAEREGVGGSMWIELGGGTALSSTSDEAAFRALAPAARAALLQIGAEGPALLDAARNLLSDDFGNVVAAVEIVREIAARIVVARRP